MPIADTKKLLYLSENLNNNSKLLGQMCEYTRVQLETHWRHKIYKNILANMHCYIRIVFLFKLALKIAVIPFKVDTAIHSDSA